MPIGSSSLGDGYSMRLWVDYLDYHYDSDGLEVRAKAPGVEASIGHQWPVSNGTVGVSLGPSYRDTMLTPSDVKSSVKGSQWGAKFQLEATNRVNNWQGELIASYIGGPESYWGRARLTYLTARGLMPGIELIVLGDPEYRATQYGVLLGNIKLGTKKTLAVKLGIRHNSGGNNDIYTGFEFSF